MPFKAFDFTEMSAMGHWCSSMAVNGAVSVHQWQESEATASMQNASSPPSSCDHAPGIRTQHHKAVDDHAAGELKLKDLHPVKKVPLRSSCVH